MRFASPQAARDWLLRFVDSSTDSDAAKAAGLAVGALAVLGTMSRGRASSHEFCTFIDGIGERYELLMERALASLNSSESDIIGALQAVAKAHARGERPD